MTIDKELDQARLSTSGITAAFPISTMAYFQFVFATITVVIMAGGFPCRMRFTTWMIFVPLWLAFSYTIGAFSLWGGGFLQVRGVIDFSGGYVIHLSSGIAGFVVAYWIGQRRREDIGVKLHNVLLMMIGAGIVWVGWNGFNGGDPYAANADASAAVFNTNLSTATSVLVWIILDLIVNGQPSPIGAVQGMFSGLVAITPAAGVVSAWGAVIIGTLSGSVPFWSMHGARNLRSFRWFKNVDDPLYVFDTHAMAGFIWGMAVGVFATKEGCAAFGITNPGGAIAGNWIQVSHNLGQALLTSRYGYNWLVLCS